MGNVAICFIESTVSFGEYVQVKRQKRIEHERIRTLIPRYLVRLNNSDVSITTLNLNGVGVDSQILRMLSRPLLSGQTRVQVLYLERTGIGPEVGATCIARLLSKDKNLKEVSLAGNPVGSLGAMAIASALEQNTSLERLDLSDCEIDDKGIEKLAISLKSNSTLQYINLEGNFISSSGVYSLLRCVYDTSSMQSLWESNHTLQQFYGRRSIYSQSFPETAANRQLVLQLGEILATSNRRYAAPSSSIDIKFKVKRTAACKILHHKNQYWECVEGMEERLLPHVIGWLVQYGNVEDIYCILRDMPCLLEKNKVEKNASESGEENV